MTKSDGALSTLTSRDIERFWAKVDRTNECWAWTGAKLPSGYGKIGVQGVVVTTHRFALTLKLGRPPIGHALHSCDNPSCVRPDHLRDGTNADNCADARARNPRAGKPPHRPGMLNGNAVLTESDVVTIRRLAASGERGKDIAQRYPVTDNLIYMIIKRQAWRHIP